MPIMEKLKEIFEFAKSLFPEPLLDLFPIVRSVRSLLAIRKHAPFALAMLKRFCLWCTGTRRELHELANHLQNHSVGLDRRAEIEYAYTLRHDVVEYLSHKFGPVVAAAYRTTLDAVDYDDPNEYVEASRVLRRLAACRTNTESKT